MEGRWVGRASRGGCILSDSRKMSWLRDKAFQAKDTLEVGWSVCKGKKERTGDQAQGIFLERCLPRKG